MLDESLIGDVRILADWPVDSDWTASLADFFRGPECKSLSDFVLSERDQKQIFPAAHDVFNAFRWCSYKNTKIVVLGQDPYHAPRQAHGLCFSVPEGEKTPPSLRNIFTELNSELAIDNRGKTDLTPWARQGVLLLNTVLTVEAGKANSHRKRGWEDFTDLVIKKLSEREQPVVFVLWGKPAAAKAKLISDHHKIVQSAHPSPLSAYRGFLGSKPFSTINRLMREMGNPVVQWQL